LPPNKAILLMVVKHSLHWLYSCCTGRSHSITLGRKKEGLCATSRIRGNPITPTPFQDMVEMWNKWHSAYLDAGLPVTWLRYEDLIFICPRRRNRRHRNVVCVSASKNRRAAGNAPMEYISPASACGAHTRKKIWIKSNF
jgi:hypothetical protein